MMIMLTILGNKDLFSITEKVSMTPVTSPNTVLPLSAMSMTPNGSTSATPSSRVVANSDGDVTGMIMKRRTFG